jgi:hypothetical protein
MRWKDLSETVLTPQYPLRSSRRLGRAFPGLEELPCRQVNDDVVAEGKTTNVFHVKLLERSKPHLGVPVRGDEEKRPPGPFQLLDNPLEEGNGREEEGQHEVPPLAASAASQEKKRLVCANWRDAKMSIWGDP